VRFIGISLFKPRRYFSSSFTDITGNSFYLSSRLVLPDIDEAIMGVITLDDDFTGNGDE
jgi:hypothetical protein